MAISRGPSRAGVTSTPKMPGRDGASTVKTSAGPRPPLRWTSTRPAVSALNESSRVR